MPLRKDEKHVANRFYCISILEGRIANTYRHLAERVENPQTKTLLLYISLDSAKHSATLKKISENITKTQTPTENCQKIMGDIWKNLTNKTIQEAAKKEKITDKEFASLINQMINLENIFAEEYLTFLHLETLQLIAKQRNIDLGSINKILKWIIQDEKRHKTTLKTIKGLVADSSK